MDQFTILESWNRPSPSSLHLGWPFKRLPSPNDEGDVVAKCIKMTRERERERGKEPLIYNVHCGLVGEVVTLKAGVSTGLVDYSDTAYIDS